MRLLFSSTDLGELQWLVKRLVHIGIPCAVCKDGGASQLSVWVQRDHDFPLALKILVNRDRSRPLPHWAGLLGTPTAAPARPKTPATRPAADAGSVPVATEGDTTRLVLVASKGTTRTLTA